MYSRAIRGQVFPYLALVLALTGAGPALADDTVPQALEAQARAGDASAAVALGTYLYGKDEDSLRIGAVHWVDQAAAAGESEALYLQGKMKRDGELGVTADWNTGVSLLQRAAAKGNGNAIFELNACCAAAMSRQYDPPKGGVERLRWALRMNERVQSDALKSEIATLARAGYGDSISTWRTDYQFDLTSAQKGDPAAIEAVANRYLSGQGVKPDLKQAEYWYQALADDGEYYHQITTARRYEAGDLGARRTGMALIYYTRAADSIRALAETGDRDAQVLLGRLYAQGKLGVSDSTAQAYGWYSRAAATGDVESQAFTGHALLSGNGTTQDTAAGVAWLTRAANNNGHRLSGDDNAKAVSAYQFELAGIYAAGVLVAADPVQADYWLELGLSNMYDDSVPTYERMTSEVADMQAIIRKSLTAEQVAATQKTVDAWHGRYDPPATLAGY